MDRHDLTGHWDGYYIQLDKRRSISADLDQRGDHLSGMMNDDCTRIEATVAELALAEGLPPGADEAIVEHLRSLVPDAPDVPIRAEVCLPPKSTLDGEVAGRVVRFRKTYQGQHFTGYRIGDVRVGSLGQGQEVDYWGQLSADGTEIEGHWRLPGDPDRGLSRRLGGSFFLRRLPAAG
jgi:hypothetical protein